MVDGGSVITRAGYSSSPQTYDSSTSGVCWQTLLTHSVYLAAVSGLRHSSQLGPARQTLLQSSGFMHVSLTQPAVNHRFKLNFVLYNTMPYDTHGGGHRGESRLYCPRTEVKFSEMTSGAQRHESSRKISLPSEDNIRAQCT